MKAKKKTWNQDHTKDFSSCLLFIHFVFSHNVVFTYFFLFAVCSFYAGHKYFPQKG